MPSQSDISPNSGPSGALASLRVVDLTQMLAGPFCAQLLADHGADVIKIESPDGDLTRSFGPYFSDDTVRSMGGYFQSVNRNKKSVVINLKSAQGKEVLLSLIDKADVVVENFRAGVLDRLGLSYESMSARNPKLVYACIRGFGDPRSGQSDYVDWPAFDVVSQAMGGMMGVTGSEDGIPMKVGPGVGDLIPSALCAFGILAAVIHAQKTGSGQFVDVAMVDGVLSCSERIVYQYAINGTSPQPEGSHHPLFCPFGMFPASDGWVTIACPSDSFWVTLCELMDRQDVLQDTRLRTNDGRMKHAAEVKKIVSAFTGVRTKAQLTAVFAVRLPYGPVYSAGDIFKDPHFATRQMLVEVEQPNSVHKLTIAGVPVKMSKTPGGVRTRAPKLGEHTRSVLMAEGLDAAAIDRLMSQGAIFCEQ